MRTMLFSCLLLLLSNVSYAKVIDFEDLTRYLSGTDLLVEGTRPAANGCMGFDWPADRAGGTLGDNPSHASAEAFLWMEGAGSTALFAADVSTADAARPFHITSLVAGSYLIEDQVVFASGGAGNGVQHQQAFLIDDAMRFARFPIDFQHINRFTFTAWDGGGTPAEGILEDLSHSLIIDDTEYEWSEPVPEPSTLLILGSGLAGLAGLIRKYRR